MKRNFAKRTSEVESSEIREILKVTERPEIISFAGGLPAPELFPIEEMKEVCLEVLTESGQQALQYSTTEGYRPLRDEIVKQMKALGIEADADDVVVLTGSQQGLDLTGKVFLDEGDIVVCESPTYLAALNAFKAYSPEFIEVKMDEQGMQMEELEKVLAANRVKIIYTIPDFQNPTGRTMSLERRKKMVELAERYGVVIVEDNPYGALRFMGEALPPIKSFDTTGCVVYMSTFSKVFAPGMRVGWICAAPEILKNYVVFKQGADLHTDTFAQMLVAKYLEKYDLDQHVEEIRAVYGKRRNLMLKTIEETFPKNVHFTEPEGGLFLWVELPEGCDAKEILTKCLDADVAFVPGGAFFPNGKGGHTFRLNYSNMPEDRIVEGIKKLAEVLKETIV